MLSSELGLPDTAVITPVYPIYRRMLKHFGGAPLKAWGWKLPPPFRFGVKDREGVIVCCPMGAPGLAMALEEIGAFGVQTAYFFGLAGGISPWHRPGDLLVPPYAHVGEGTSRYYGGAPLSFPDPVLSRALTAGLGGRETVHTSAVFSTDALYRETGALLHRLTVQDVRAIDMETSAFFSVCRAISIRGAAILWVSDLLTREGWDPHFYGPELRRALSVHLKGFRKWFLRGIVDT